MGRVNIGDSCLNPKGKRRGNKTIFSEADNGHY